MEEEIAGLFKGTQSPAESTRKQAELQLRQLQSRPGFALALVSVASHDQLPIDVRQAALLYCRTHVLANWSPSLDEYTGQVIINDEDKKQIRESLLVISTSDYEDRKVKAAASIVVSKIATADFPDEWPDLLSFLLDKIPNTTDGQLHGCLKVLLDLVDDCFNEDRFFKVARDLVNTVKDVALDQNRKPILRALAVSVFRSCFNTLEMIMEDHKDAIKGFTEETLQSWNPFFLDILSIKLPPAPNEDDENQDTEASERYRGLVALKLQVAKVLMRIRTLFPSTFARQSWQFFTATWEELSSMEDQYLSMYIADDRQGRLEDADGLPYTLDFLVLEYLDFMQASFRAPPVRKELTQSLKSRSNKDDLTGTWVTGVMQLIAGYAQITMEEEGMWDIDVNIFLSEEEAVTANYTPRTACGDFLIKLAEGVDAPIAPLVVDGLLVHTRTLYTSDTDWKAKEAALYLLNQLLGDWQDIDKTLNPDHANGFVEFARYAMQQEDVFLRARGYLVAARLIRMSGQALSGFATSFLESSLNAISHDSSDVVKVSCIRALDHYLTALPSNITLPLQATIVSSLAHYLSQLDVNELNESEDVMLTLVQTLRDAILLDTQICVNGSALDLLFTLANHGAGNFQIAMSITECFEEVSENFAGKGAESFAQLCAKVLPSLASAFDVAQLTEENTLTNLAADLLNVLAEHGSSPLPQGFAVTVMPRVQRILMAAHDDELLRSASCCVKHMIEHDAAQVFAWHDASGANGLQVVLIIIDRLLGPEVSDNAANEVGGLAAALVENAGSEKLGQYMMQLLRAVAERLAAAEPAGLIQNLILVFARLSLVSPSEVVDFLSQLQIADQNGLQIVMTKWLENSVNFAGYEEIRQNVVALSKLYDLEDARLSQVQVKGDLIVTQTDRIVTRSRAKQNPDQHTIIPANLKIVKVLVEELLSASGNAAGLGVNATGDDDDDEDDEDGDDWEDEPNPLLDLGSGMTKEQLMAYGNEGPGMRGRDDETQAYLLEWFRGQANKPAFGQVFQALTESEQEKLRSMSG